MWTFQRYRITDIGSVFGGFGVVVLGEFRCYFSIILLKIWLPGVEGWKRAAEHLYIASGTPQGLIYKIIYETRYKIL